MSKDSTSNFPSSFPYGGMICNLVRYSSTSDVDIIFQCTRQIPGYDMIKVVEVLPTCHIFRLLVALFYRVTVKNVNVIMDIDTESNETILHVTCHGLACEMAMGEIASYGYNVMTLDMEPRIMNEYSFIQTIPVGPRFPDVELKLHLNVTIMAPPFNMTRHDKIYNICINASCANITEIIDTCLTPDEADAIDDGYQKVGSFNMNHIPRVHSAIIEAMQDAVNIIIDADTLNHITNGAMYKVHVINPSPDRHPLMSCIHFVVAPTGVGMWEIKHMAETECTIRPNRVILRQLAESRKCEISELTITDYIGLVAENLEVHNLSATFATNEERNYVFLQFVSSLFSAMYSTVYFLYTPKCMNFSKVMVDGEPWIHVNALPAGVPVHDNLYMHPSQNIVALSQKTNATAYIQTHIGAGIRLTFPVGDPGEVPKHVLVYGQANINIIAHDLLTAVLCRYGVYLSVLSTHDGIINFVLEDAFYNRPDSFIFTDPDGGYNGIYKRSAFGNKIITSAPYGEDLKDPDECAKIIHAGIVTFLMRMMEFLINHDNELTVAEIFDDAGLKLSNAELIEMWGKTIDYIHRPYYKTAFPEAKKAVMDARRPKAPVEEDPHSAPKDMGTIIVSGGTGVTYEKPKPWWKKIFGA